MVEDVKAHVRNALAEGKIAGFLGLKDESGNIVPFLFEKPEDLDNGFSLGAVPDGPPQRYPMAKLVIGLLRRYPDKKFGVLVRGCDERALNELIRWNQMTDAAEKILKIGFACKPELAQAHECRQPFPEECVAGEKAEGVANDSVNEISGLDLGARLEYWQGEFERCIKCYGCRDVCPVCFCNVCTLEEDALIKTGDLPPENPIFHLTRAVHMAGRCIDCNLCSEACPADIPLRTLYKRVAEIVQQEFGYVTGLPGDGKSPLNFLGPDPGHTSAND